MNLFQFCCSFGSLDVLPFYNLNKTYNNLIQSLKEENDKGTFYFYYAMLVSSLTMGYEAEGFFFSHLFTI